MRRPHSAVWSVKKSGEKLLLTYTFQCCGWRSSHRERRCWSATCLGLFKDLRFQACRIRLFNWFGSVKFLVPQFECQAEARVWYTARGLISRKMKMSRVLLLITLKRSGTDGLWSDRPAWSVSISTQWLPAVGLQLGLRNDVCPLKPAGHDVMLSIQWLKGIKCLRGGLGRGWWWNWVHVPWAIVQ